MEQTKAEVSLPDFAVRTELEAESLRLLLTVEQTRREMSDYYPRLIEDEALDPEAQERAESFKRASSNITRALTQTYSLSDGLSARLSDIRNQRKKKKLISSAPANAVIDLNEQESAHFARGRNLYKLLLLCFIGSFLGVVIEMLWCLLRNGYLESRSGLIWGPFNLVYGAGAVALTLSLYPVRNHSPWISFLGGFAVGSVLEYLCSWGQEMLLGSTSWDYSGHPFNLNGRICLLYSVFWGLLGVFWIKDLYPRMAKLILKIPNHAGKIATWALTGFFVLNACVSLIAVSRWSERVAGIEPSNSFWVMVDERFPDSRMERVFANMEFGEDPDK